MIEVNSPGYSVFDESIRARAAPSRHWYSFTYPGRMESWVSLGGKEGHTNIQISAEPGSKWGPCNQKAEILQMNVWAGTVGAVMAGIMLLNNLFIKNTRTQTQMWKKIDKFNYQSEKLLKYLQIITKYTLFRIKKALYSDEGLTSETSVSIRTIHLLS